MTLVLAAYTGIGVAVWYGARWLPVWWEYALLYGAGGFGLAFTRGLLRRPATPRPDPIDDLAALFFQARLAGIDVPDGLPLDTPGHRRASALFISGMLYQYTHRKETL